MCVNNDCNGCTGCAPVGPMGPAGPKGNAGANGTNGVSVVNSFVSNGVALIGNILYPLNTLVHLLSNGTYLNAGLINVPDPNLIVWQDMILKNGWANGVGILKAQFAIVNGFLHQRGRINFSAATDDNYATMDVGFTGDVYSSGITDKAGVDLELSQEALITINASGDISALGAVATLDGARLILDSIPPISIR